MEFILTGDQVSAAPEPGTLALLAGAAGLLTVFLRQLFYRLSRSAKIVSSRRVFPYDRSRSPPPVRRLFPA
jgi:hypothetical protein